MLFKPKKPDAVPVGNVFYIASGHYERMAKHAATIEDPKPQQTLFREAVRTYHMAIDSQNQLGSKMGRHVWFTKKAALYKELSGIYAASGLNGVAERYLGLSKSLEQQADLKAFKEVIRSLE